MFTGFTENVDILNDSQNIRLLFQKVQNPIMTQIKASLKVSYDMYQANTVTYDFISNSLESEAASLGDHNLRGVTDVKTCGEKAPESGIKGAGGAIFAGLYPNWYKLSDGEKLSVFDKRDRLNINGGGKRNSFNKKNRSGMHPSSPKNKSAQDIQIEISYLKAKCKELEENVSAIEGAGGSQDNLGDQFASCKGKKQQKSSD